MKVKSTIIPKLKNMTRTEWQLFEFLVVHQEETTARVEGVYYRDVLQETGMCKQSFYNAMNGLQEQGIIAVEKNSGIDYDITICGNDFPWKGNPKETYQDGYVSLARDGFKSRHYKHLNGHEKYLVFEFLHRTHEGRGSFRIGKQNFYDEWTAALGVTARVLRSYLHHLKSFFSIGVKAGMMYITYKHSTWKKEAGQKSEIMYCYEQIIRKECNRLHTQYTPDSLHETAEIIQQYKDWAGGLERVCELIRSCMERMVENIKRSDRRLLQKVIGKFMSDHFRQQNLIADPV